jgi:hypothetical protein
MITRYNETQKMKKKSRLKPNAKAYQTHFTQDGRLGQLMLVVR